WIPPTQPPSRPGPQTGPKGVVADYRHHRKQERLRLEAERRRAVAELTKRTAGVSLNDQPTFTQKEERTLNSGMRVAGDSEDDYDEDEFLRQYRTRRLDQLKMDRSTFGAVREIGESGYVDAIDKEPPAVPMPLPLITITIRGRRKATFDSLAKIAGFPPSQHLPPCRRVNECLTALAAKYKLAKFLRIAAGPLQFDEVGLPVLLTYKAGKVVSNHTRVSDELSRIDVDSLEALLLKCVAALCGAARFCADGRKAPLTTLVGRRFVQ
ncbi:MAG: hypothetical protein BJ554DRAFT_389, partial [Olpidium bornovanus]